MPRLCKEFDILSKNEVFKRVVPDFIEENLNSRFKLRYYQEEAISRFIYYLEKYKERIRPTQLLFHMATGSGKTLIMAANILYLYKQGYRKFLFFVDSTDTIKKTKDNFLNKNATKYLFSEKISIDGENIRIREINNFYDSNKNDINILFSTIQGLHTKFNNPKENTITYEDIKDDKIALISDEAHHLNALTKSRKNKSDKKNIQTWEGTIKKVFQRNSDNILLEYTATVPTHEAVTKKYDNKIIYQYPLKKFRIDKYSKEVEVLEGDFDKKTRTLQALILSQYRRKIAEKNGLALKPVVMIKSKRIKMSKDFEKEFYGIINNLDSSRLAEIKDTSSSKIIKEAFNFFDEQEIDIHNLAKEFKEEFSKEKCVSVNNKNESEEKQILVNTLEDKDNQVRVIFAVDKLNEGWDVLNLFDIVRLYETGGSKRGKPKRTTIKEAQLIGRGARYWPFNLTEEHDRFKRKYDDDIKNELRVLEELYYHCYNEPSYISELKQVLEDTGIIPKQKKEVKLKVKDEFKETPLWKKGLIFVNEKDPSRKSDIEGLNDFNIDQTYKYELRTGYSSEIKIFNGESSEITEKKTETYKLSDFRNNILRKALSKLEFYKFKTLISYFPKLSSIKEFISEEEYLKNIQVEVTGRADQVKNLKSKEMLEITIDVCRKISQKVKSNSTEYTGTKVFIGKPVKEVIKDKTRKFDIESNRSGEEGTPLKKSNNSELRMDLSEKDWYIYNENYGTDQEKYFIRFINNWVEDLREKYDYVYLVRNERLFQLYNFDDGQAFEPDFILFTKNESEEPCHYQLFVEPKGGHLIPKDKWKEKFLEKIKEEHTLRTLVTDERYRIMGLPFFNEEIGKERFKSKFKKELNLT